MLFIMLFSLQASVVRGQQAAPGLTGTDFWVSFLQNDWPALQNYYIVVGSADTCTAYVENPQQGWDTTISLAAGEVSSVKVPTVWPSNLNQINPGWSFGDEAWHVSTTAQAVVYASNYIEQSHDMASVMPTETLRCDYMLQTYSGGMAAGGPEVHIVAPCDSTVVCIYFAENVCERVNSRQTNLLYSPGDSVEVLLMRGQTCRLMSSPPGGFTGTRVHSSKPVAVFQGHFMTTVPGIHEFGNHNYGAMDHLFEQCPPTDCWGTRFLVIPTTGRVLSTRDTVRRDTAFGGDMVKVTALHDNCVVTVDTTVADTLSSGETYTFLVANHSPVLPADVTLDFYQSDALPIRTSSSAMVCYYITSEQFGGFPGDPAAAVVPPVEQCIGSAIVPVKDSPHTQNHTLNIVAPTTDAPMMTLDGLSIASAFSPAAFGLSYARVSVGEGTHLLDANGGQFQAVLYGLGDFESYAMSACMALRKIDFDFGYDVSVSGNDLCEGDTLTVVVRHADERLGVEWSLGGMSLGAGFDTLRLSFASAGRYTLTIVVTPMGDTVRKTVTVHPDFSLLETDTLCRGESLRWQGRTLAASGCYVDSLHSVFGCDSVMSLQLTVLEAPHSSFVLETDCENYRYGISGTVVGDTAGYSFAWQSSPPDAALDGQPWDSLGLSPSNTTTYFFSITGPCPFDTAFTLHPIRWPVAEMLVRPETLSVDRLDFVAYDQSRNADFRHWWVDGRYAGEESMLYDRANALEDSLRLTLVAVNETCTDTLTRLIPIIHSAVWVPNTFTPGASTNSRFAPMLNECTAEDLYVYNRQGLLVAHIEGDNPSWDGTHDGTPCVQGAYVWVLRYHTDHEPSLRQERVGTVLLLK